MAGAPSGCRRLPESTVNWIALAHNLVVPRAVSSGMGLDIFTNIVQLLSSDLLMQRWSRTQLKCVAGRSAGIKGEGGLGDGEED